MKKIINLVVFLYMTGSLLNAGNAMTNYESRKKLSLNGTWKIIIDPADVGEWREIWKEKKPVLKTDFVEYSFENNIDINVPGDFNSQRPELTYYEGTVWYQKSFHFTPDSSKRLFMHFGAVNYLADVYLNGSKLGSHEGGFTPFQFEVTNLVKKGLNTIVVKVNNRRQKDGIPATGFDWLNYGGITRDVNLIETGATFIQDYSVQLQKNTKDVINGWVRLNGTTLSQSVEIEIPELKIKYRSITHNGITTFNFKAKPELWEPVNPKRYKVFIKILQDSVVDDIGFRTLEIKDAKVLLNGKAIFFKGVNIHEENPLSEARATSDADAVMLLNWAKELGCNMVRLAHYPHNEYMVKMAEKMGLMVWSEIPVYQHIEFSNSLVEAKIRLAMEEMIARDRNRCAVVVWCLSNETYSFTPNRDKVLLEITRECRKLDSTRLITSVICNQSYEKNTITVWDSICRNLDFISVNEYLGWYVPWQGNPEEVKWIFDNPGKPVFISEFGGEALYGNETEEKDKASSWSEEYQEKIYKDQLSMFRTIPNLMGVCPWLLVDYRSPGRMHPLFQNGWNRKGLISNRGQKKKAWFVMHDFYRKK